VGKNLGDFTASVRTSGDPPVEGQADKRSDLPNIGVSNVGIALKETSQAL